MTKAARACAEAASALAGLNDAASVIRQQLTESEARYANLVDEARRAEVIVTCEARADRIDVAAEKLRDAAEHLNRARLDFVAADGIAGMDYQSTYSAALLAAPVINQAVRPGGQLDKIRPFLGAVI